MQVARVHSSQVLCAGIEAVSKLSRHVEVSVVAAGCLGFIILPYEASSLERAQAAQDALLKRAKANSLAQLGKYDPASEDESAGDRTYEKNYVY